MFGVVPFQNIGRISANPAVFPVVPPIGYLFLVDDDGNYLIDSEGNYLVTPA